MTSPIFYSVETEKDPCGSLSASCAFLALSYDEIATTPYVTMKQYQNQLEAQEHSVESKAASDESPAALAVSENNNFATSKTVGANGCSFNTQVLPEIADWNAYQDFLENTFNEWALWLEDHAERRNKLRQKYDH